MTNYPQIDVVVIGLNVQQFLSHSLQSVIDSNYPKDKLNILYVDSSSSDNSVDIANNFKEVKTLFLGDTSPSSAKARNMGFVYGNAEYVQFLDADSCLKKNWLKLAVNTIQQKDIGAVLGILQERYPQKNIFHKIAAMEWNISKGLNGFSNATGLTSSFGGNVLVRRSAVKNAGLYNTKLLAGEDPELSYRMRRVGWKIIKINTIMASHDIATDNWNQYLKRAMRSGWAYFSISRMYMKSKEKFYLREVFRIVGFVLFPVLFTILGFIFHPVIILLAALLAFRHLITFPRFIKKYNMAPNRALLYSAHIAFVVYPQFAGVIKGLLKK